MGELPLSQKRRWCVRRQIFHVTEAVHIQSHGIYGCLPSIQSCTGRGAAEPAAKVFPLPQKNPVSFLTDSIASGAPLACNMHPTRSQSLLANVLRFLSGRAEQP